MVGDQDTRGSYRPRTLLISFWKPEDRGAVFYGNIFCRILICKFWKNIDNNGESVASRTFPVSWMLQVRLTEVLELFWLHIIVI